MTHHDRIADRLTIILARHGLDTRRVGSALSGSQYIYVQTDDGEIKIRISDHVARPTYERDHGAAAIEIGAHDMATHGGAMCAAQSILKRLGITPDAALRRSIAMAAGKAAAKAAKDADKRAEVASTAEGVLTAHHDRLNTLIRWNPERWGAIKDLPGKSGKEKRRVFRRQAEAALGLPPQR